MRLFLDVGLSSEVWENEEIYFKSTLIIYVHPHGGTFSMHSYVGSVAWYFQGQHTLVCLQPNSVRWALIKRLGPINL